MCNINIINNIYIAHLLNFYIICFLVEVTKRQSVTSAGSGSVTELRLEEKRMSDAHSLTESRDYTFEESEDDIGTHGTHVESKEKAEVKHESDFKTKTVSG